MREWPVLYKTSSTGKEQSWKISISPLEQSNSCDIVTLYGQVGGKIQESRVTIREGKNIGRSNETTPYQQAESEAQSKWTKQLDNGYSEARGGDVAGRALKPMLAHTYEEHASKVNFDDTYLQPKLDGQRCIAARTGDEITLTSRNGKPIVTMGHIVDNLRHIMADGDVLDGELYNHDLTFQQIMSFVKKLQPGSERIQFHIYDTIPDNPSKTFSKRFFYHPAHEIYLEISSSRPLDSLSFVDTREIQSVDEIWKFHGYWVKQGYEGVMIRHGGCHYKSGGRSNQLLKVKKFIDAEYTIVDVIPDGVARPTHGKFVCVMPDEKGATFEVVPEGPFLLKEEYLTNREGLVGKHLTVRYFEMTTSENPVPRFPIGIAVRDE